MRTGKLFAIGILAFLLTFSTVIPVVANDWGSPLATDTLGDYDTYGEDISSVDARYANEFAFFRFQMNAYIVQWMYYHVLVDFDKNNLTGDLWSDSDVGQECYMTVGIEQVFPDIEVSVRLGIFGNPDTYVYYNMTANNGTAIDWTMDPDNWILAPLINVSQSDIVFGVNWTWLTLEFASNGFNGDNCSMYLEFKTEWDTDWCPDRTSGETDYIEWDLCADTRGIPGFSTGLALFCLLTVLAAMLLLDRKRVKV